MPNKKLYYLLEHDFFDGISLVMTPTERFKWMKQDIGDMELANPRTYKVTTVWLTAKEVKQLKEADI